MIEKILVPGPTIFGKRRDAIITVRRNPRTSSVKWDIGAIDICGPASDAVSKRCEASGMHDDLRAWWTSVTPRKPDYGSFSCRWGFVKGIPNQSENNPTKTLVAIIQTHWVPAFINLPIHSYDFDEAHP